MCVCLCCVRLILFKENQLGHFSSLCWLVQTLVAAYPWVEDTDSFSPSENRAPLKLCPECDSLAQQHVLALHCYSTSKYTDYRIFQLTRHPKHSDKIIHILFSSSNWEPISILNFFCGALIIGTCRRGYW